MPRKDVESTFSVVGRIACSWWLLLIVLVAPLLWGLLPLGYTYIKSTSPIIKANPTFIVAMRMGFSFLGMSALTLAIVCIGARKTGYSLRGYVKQLGKYFNGKVWGCLIVLAVAYFGARLVEMKCILDFDFYADEPAASTSMQKNLSSDYKATFLSTQNEHSYIKTQTASAPTEVVQSQQSAAAKASTDAIQEFGYFMGLLLALMCPVLFFGVGWLCERFAQWVNWSAGAGAAKVLKGESLTFVGGLSLVVTGFLIVASGILNLAAREPLYAWRGVLPMLGLALVVACFTCVTSICKTEGGPGADVSEGEDVLAKHSILKAFTSCFAMNAAMSLGAAVLAFLRWLFLGDATTATAEKCWSGLLHTGAQCALGEYAKELFVAFFRDGRWIPFVVIIVLCGSIVAPVAQLLGVQLHEKTLRDRHLSDYGIRGGDWLRICGGCEPFFVVLVGILMVGLSGWCPWAKPCVAGENPFINGWPIGISVLTVFVIIVLRIMETWAEKNSTLRNYIYTRVRGSSRGMVDREDGEKDEAWMARLCDQYNMIMTRQRKKMGEPWDPVDFENGKNTEAVSLYLQWLRERAMNLSVLKLYDKRSRLANDRLRAVKLDGDKETAVAKHGAVDAWTKEHSNVKCFFIDFQGCDVYFTQDDPYSHDALDAMMDWLKIRRLMNHQAVSINSFSYTFRANCDESNPETSYKNLKGLACDIKSKGTPFVICVSGDNPERVAESVVADWNEIVCELNGLVSEGRIVGRANREVLRQMDVVQKEGV